MSKSVLPVFSSRNFIVLSLTFRSLIDLEFFCVYTVFSSVAQCPIPCDPMDCSSPSFPDHHQLPELAQTQVHCIHDAIQPSHPLSSLSPPAFPSIRVFSNESALHIRWPKYWSFSISSSSEYSGLISFRIDLCDLLAVQGDFRFSVEVSKKSVIAKLLHVMKSLSRVRLFVTPWTVAHQAPPPMEFSRQEYWSGLPFPSPKMFLS